MVDSQLESVALVATTVAPATTTTEAPATAKRLLSYTVVTGWLRGEHRCPYEVHATGCRDLRKLQRFQPSVEYLAEDHEHAMAQAIDDMGGATGRHSYWVQPCCSPVRMRAAGRA